MLGISALALAAPPSDTGTGAPRQITRTAFDGGGTTSAPTAWRDTPPQQRS